jgi:hypothetical protein
MEYWNIGRLEGWVLKGGHLFLNLNCIINSKLNYPRTLYSIIPAFHSFLPDTALQAGSQLGQTPLFELLLL